MVHWTKTSLWIFLGASVASINCLILVPLFLYHLGVTINIVIDNAKGRKSKSSSPKSCASRENHSNKLILPIWMLFTVTCYTIMSISNITGSMSEALAVKPNCTFFNQFSTFWL